MAKTVTARANRSFGTIREGDVVTIDETDARMQAFLSSGYMTEVEGDDAKGAKKVASLEDEENVIVWDGAPGNRRGATTTGAPARTRPARLKRRLIPSPTRSLTVVKESNGLGDAYLAEELGRFSGCPGNTRQGN